MRSVTLRLYDVIQAIEHIHTETSTVSLEDFEASWQKRWLVERGIEIISEATQHLPDVLKSRHSDIPWPKIAGIGNVLRHDYERIAPDVLWGVVRDHLPALDKACRAEMAQALRDDSVASMPLSAGCAPTQAPHLEG